MNVGPNTTNMIKHLESRFPDDLKPMHHDFDGTPRIQMLINDTLGVQGHALALPIKQDFTSRVNEKSEKSRRKDILVKQNGRQQFATSENQVNQLRRRAYTR